MISWSNTFTLMSAQIIILSDSSVMLSGQNSTVLFLWDGNLTDAILKVRVVVI